MGLFIAIEGGDGSGKATHSELLAEYLRQQGKEVYKLSFPRYDQPSGRYPGRYLNGDYGDAASIHPDLSSMPYAIDRFAAKQDIQAALAKPDGIVIADRYIASNLAHQGASPYLTTDEVRHTFYDEIKELEFTILGVVRPNLNIVLVMPTQFAQDNVDKKEARSYTDKKRDILEADASHLDKAKANFEELCRLYPEEFLSVECADESGSLRTIDDIQQEIRQLILGQV